MFVKCKDIVNLMELYAPVNLAESWDNVGLMLGENDLIIKKILAALDINDDVIDEAIEKNADMIITHHPFIFKPIKNINSETVLGKRIYKLIRNNICVYSAHTNLDIAENGTNDTFAKMLELKDIQNLCEPVNGQLGLGKVGLLENEMKFIDFVEKVKKTINVSNLVISGDKNKAIKKVGIGTGKCSGSSYMFTAFEKGCDAYITGDVGYHDAQTALNLGLCLIDATHYSSEVIVIPVIAEYINKYAKDNSIELECIISEVDGQTLNIC